MKNFSTPIKDRTRQEIIDMDLRSELPSPSKDLKMHANSIVMYGLLKSFTIKYPFSV